MRSVQGNFPSSNGTGRVAFYVYLPECKPKCIVQIAHGMCENALLYKGLAKYLTDRGCIVCANDFLGHGRSIRGREDIGFFAPKNGWRCLVRDMKKLTDIVSRKFPSLSIVLIGHSMGSFAAREYLTWYGDGLAGCVLVGTSDGFDGQKLLVAFADALCLYKNGNYTMHGIMKCGCELFCSKMRCKASGWDWLTRDRKIRDLMDRHSFDYTASAYRDIITLLDVVSAPDWVYSVPRELPLLLMSGMNDGVGDCGRGVAKLYRRLKNAGHDDLRVRLYAGARHMLLHEVNRKTVYRDLYDWITRVIIQKRHERE